jgi:uncharacterized RDD family membrane protein YckC
MAERLAASGARSGTGAGYLPENSYARLGVRALAYVIDSVALFGFAMVFATVAGLVIFISSDYGEENPGDSSFTALVAVLMAAMPAWLAVNLGLALKRDQTLGQFVMGMRATTEDSGRPGPARLLAYWLALHPLLFHPIFAGFWLLVGFYAIDGGVLLVVCIALALLCIAAPVAALVFALLDPEHRALHDRLAGMRVVQVV